MIGRGWNVRRVLGAVVLFVAAVAGMAAAAPLSSQAAGGCDPGRLTPRLTATYAEQAQVVAVGTLRGAVSGIITLVVDDYYRAPDGRPALLRVNNYFLAEGPDCEPKPVLMRRFDAWTRVVAFLEPDRSGVGADWRGLSSGRGLFPILPDGRVVFGDDTPPLAEVTAMLTAALGQPFATDPGDLQRTAPVPATTFLPVEIRPACMAPAPTIENFSSRAEFAVVATVTAATEHVATIKVESWAGPAPPWETLKVNNRVFVGRLTTCHEEVTGGNRFAVGQRLFLFLRTDATGGQSDWRLAGVDGLGAMAVVDGDRVFDGLALTTLEDALERSESAITRWQANASQLPRPAPAGSLPLFAAPPQERGDNDWGPPSWAVVTAFMIAGAISVFLILRPRGG